MCRCGDATTSDVVTDATISSSLPGEEPDGSGGLNTLVFARAYARLSLPLLPTIPPGITCMYTSGPCAVPRWCGWFGFSARCW